MRLPGRHLARCVMASNLGLDRPKRTRSSRCGRRQDVSAVPPGFPLLQPRQLRARLRATRAPLPAYEARPRQYLRRQRPLVARRFGAPARY